MQLQQLGPYVIGRKIGRGGMGTVYEATTDTGETVAVKVLSAAMSHDEGFRERFEGEIESLKKLKHPNIVKLLGHGEQDGLLFYGMELVRGTSLEDELQSGKRFDWQAVTQFGIQMSRALKHAHDSGVVHRDIKPANLLHAETGELKLTDFGIAKLFGATHLTADGGVLGTAEYMAPEQAEGRVATHRSDLYSLGGVLYALLAGRPPFRAKSIPEMLQLQRYAEPEPVRRHCPDVPAELASIVSQLLEKDPEKRISSAMILSRRLEAMEHGLSARRGDAEFKQTVAEPGSGEIKISAKSASDSGSDSPLDVTRADTPGPPKSSLAMRVGESAGLGETQLTGQGSPDPGYSIADAPSPATKSTQSRFTTVEDESESEASAFRETLAILTSPQTWLLIGSLACMAAIAVWMLRPPSAEKLYEEVVAKANDEDPARLVDAEASIKRFLEIYPEDERVKEMEGYRDDIELIKLERRFDRQARQLKTQQSSAVLRAYAEAMHVAAFDPQQAIVQLEALLALYGQDDERETPSRLLSDPRELAVQLAQRKLVRLRAIVKEQAQEDLKTLKQRLAIADKLFTTQPAKARAMLESLVVLYEKKPWAEQVVEQARKRLAMPDPEPQTARAGS